MRIVAKGVVSPAYHGYGRKWPRDTSVEFEVTPEEYAEIAKDHNIVCLVIPEATITPIAAIKITEQPKTQQKGK